MTASMTQKMELNLTELLPISRELELMPTLKAILRYSSLRKSMAPPHRKFERFYAAALVNLEHESFEKQLSTVV